MGLKIAVQMDPVHLLNFETDSTISLIKEAQLRDYSVYCYTPAQMFMSAGKVYAKCQTIKIFNKEYELGETSVTCLEEFDVVLMRQDPPFDINYITATYLLEKIHPRTLVVNSPTEVRNLPEKLFICNYPELMPPTTITQDFEVVQEFLSEHKQIVLKPLYAFGGADVVLASDSKSTKQAFDHIIEKYRAALVVQKFLPEVKFGDKRVILINGAAVGAVNRIPAQESIKANLVAGGTATKTTITFAEQKICRIIGAELKSRGIIIAGIDLIGDYITEVNVTCPTTFNAINNLYQLHAKDRIESLAWDAILDAKSRLSTSFN